MKRSRGVYQLRSAPLIVPAAQERFIAPTLSTMLSGGPGGGLSEEAVQALDVGQVPGELSAS